MATQEDRVMDPIKIEEVGQYVEQNIGSFHKGRLDSLVKLKLSKILERKNPYLFKARNILLAQDLVRILLDAHLSSQEETIFGNFLEGLAIFVNGKSYNGWKSSTQGIDLEFNKDNIRYIVAIKSGPNWGNSSQIRKMQDDFDVQIEVENDGTVKIASVDKDSTEKAISTIRSLTEEPEVGKIYTGKVTHVTNYGAFVEIFPGQEGLLHISELEDGYVKRVEDVINAGDEVTVKLVEIDKFGRLNLSRKAAMDDGTKPQSTRPGKSLRLPKDRRR